MEKITLEGNYHDNPIEIFISKAMKPVQVVTIFVHGLYGVFDPIKNSDKINLLVKRLTDENISNCVSYNSARDFQFDHGTDYDKRREAFKEKTFLQELDDLKTVVRWVINNSEKTFGIKKCDLFINIHGNSLGGTLALLLGDFFPMIRKISLCGSGCGTSGSQKPILSTSFQEKVILDSISQFTGNLLLLQGSEDTTVPLESGLKILEHAVNAKKNHTVVPSANHNFSKINGLESVEAKNQFINIIFDFISKI